MKFEIDLGAVQDFLPVWLQTFWPYIVVALGYLIAGLGFTRFCRRVTGLRPERGADHEYMAPITTLFWPIAATIMALVYATINGGGWVYDKVDKGAEWATRPKGTRPPS